MSHSVLFVCLGNICRSPMAEAVFKHTVDTTGVGASFKEIDSCGTAGYHVGEAPDIRTLDICKKYNVPVDHSARKLCAKDFETFDYLLCMDMSNLSDVKSRQPKNSKSKVLLFGDFDPQGEKIIQDPYYGGSEGFERNFQQVSRCSKGFLKSLGLS